jgi:hypothetical protein
MSAVKLVPGDQVRVIGGVYTGCDATIVKVTKHMYQIHLVPFVGSGTDHDVVRVMSWNVEGKKVLVTADELVSEVLLLRDQFATILELFEKLEVKKE